MREAKVPGPRRGALGLEQHGQPHCGPPVQLQRALSSEDLRVLSHLALSPPAWGSSHSQNRLGPWAWL